MGFILVGKARVRSVISLPLVGYSDHGCNKE